MKTLLVFLCLLAPTSCGYDSKTVEYRDAPPPDPNATYADIAPLVEQYCAPCHNSPPRVKITEANWSTARKRVVDGTMPPGGMPEADRAELLRL